MPPQTRAIDTLLFRLSTPGPGTLLGGGYFIDNVFVSTKCPDDFQGFETDIKGWDVFSSPVFFPTRVPSGMDGITSASGAWHAIASATAGQVPAGNWGGYGANCECGSTSCAVTEFPLHGYLTSVDIYLDMEAGFADDTRFDFSSAINRPDGSHRRDFIFNAGFYSAGDPTLPGTGSDRFIVSASNNSGQPPFNPPADPIAITTTGWYTFQNRFYRTAGDVLAVDYMIRDAAGTLINQWTRSDPSDVIGVTVGGNRYGWFPTNGFDNLAFDNASRSVGGDGELALTVADCQDDAFPGEAGYQVEIQLEMLNLTSLATGFQAFLDYDMGTLLYRGDLSSYSASPFLQHISPVNQLDDGVLELDGSTAPLAPGTDADAVLATLVFDVTGTALCNPSSPAVFEAGGGFASEISFSGIPLATALTNPSAFTLDDTPPTLSPCPADITQSADANSALGCGGAFVTFTDPTATDNCDPSPSVVCTPASGSFFPTGISVVECVATDACGNISTCMFNVEVTATNDIDVVVELVGVNLPVSRCIYFQTTDSCGVTTDHEISFIDHDGDDANTNGIDDSTEGGSNTPSTPVRGVDTITVSCGVYTGLCAKDEQHTQWGNTVALTAGVSYTAGGVISLEGGDTDNDGDVDINDVTLLLSQFGSVVPSGTCPWDGTRDADFDNDSAVGALDYGFLVANWLTMSSCACTSPSVGFGPRRWLQVDGPTTAAVDFNRDGRVDAGDVEIFEQRHGLSGELSRRMRLGGR